MSAPGLPSRRPISWLTIKSHGVEVIENPDVESLRAAVQSVYDAYPQYADYIARIQALLAE